VRACVCVCARVRVCVCVRARVCVRVCECTKQLIEGRLCKLVQTAFTMTFLWPMLEGAQGLPADD